MHARMRTCPWALAVAASSAQGGGHDRPTSKASCALVRDRLMCSHDCPPNLRHALRKRVAMPPEVFK
eukprot:13116579-Alexandrium_andersonii.AAC.1